MTSMLTLDDIEDDLVRAGIISPYIRQRILAKVKQYAMKYPVPEKYEEDIPVFIPVVTPSPDPRYEYKCPACKEKKLLREFPARKQENRRSPVPCLECQPEA